MDMHTLIDVKDIGIDIFQAWCVNGGFDEVNGIEGGVGERHLKSPFVKYGSPLSLCLAA
jgi:hypothetical protein